MTDQIENQEELQDEDIVILQDEDGNDVEFYHVATVDYKGKWYVFLQPVDEMDDMEDDEVLIFELSTDENGDDLFLSIDDENLLNEVYAEFEKMADDECECGDDCDCHHDHKHEHECSCGCEKDDKHTNDKCNCGDDCNCK